MGIFSPQFDALACGSQAGKKVEHLEDSANGELNTNTNNDNVVAELILEENSEVVRSASVESINSLQDLYGQKTQNQEKISVADVICRACTQLLFRPVVLNCGHGIYNLLFIPVWACILFYLQLYAKRKFLSIGVISTLIPFPKYLDFNAKKVSIEFYVYSIL